MPNRGALLGLVKPYISGAARGVARAILPFFFVSAAFASPPEFVFSTLLGGAGGDQLTAVVRDASGGVYVAGTASTTSNPPWAQMLVAKYSAQGSLVWSRAIDFGDRLGSVSGVGVTASGGLCVVGSALPPPLDQSVHRFGPGGDVDGLVVLVTADGALESTTYIGGSRSDAIDGVAVAPDGSIVLVGMTGSDDFPTLHPFQSRYGGTGDAFVAVLSADATTLLASSYLGGGSEDSAAGVAVDAQGSIWVAGSTISAGVPFGRTLPGTSPCGAPSAIFLTKLAPGGRHGEFSILLCGSRPSLAHAVAVDGDGNAYVVGQTYAPDFPTTPGALKTSISGSGTTDAFVTAVASTGDRLLFSTYLGGSDGGWATSPGFTGVEDAFGVTVDASRRVFVVGATTSTDFPVIQPLQPQHGDSDLANGFLSVLDAKGSRLDFSTYLGGAGGGSANALGVAVPAFGRVVVVGAASSDFPVANAAQPIFGGGLTDGFVAEIALEPVPLSASATASPASGLAPLSVALQCVPSGGVPPYTFAGTSVTVPRTRPSRAPAICTRRVGVTSRPRRSPTRPAPSASASVAVSVTPNCWVACSASVPLAVSAGSVTTFAGSAMPTDCSGEVSYSWAFGDGQSSTQQNPSHSYASAGLYTWSLTAGIGAASCTRNGTIVVTAAPATSSHLIPALAHKPGNYGSQWRADVTVVNPNDAAANLTLAYFSESAPVLRAAVLPGHGTVEWTDVLVSLFGFPQDASTSGVVQVISDVSVASIGRSYNLAPGGTFGGAYPALAIGDGVASGKIGILPQLKRNASFRSNVGFANPGTFTTTVRLRLFGQGGVKLGEKSLDVAAGRWTQLDDVFGTLGAGDADLAYATVEVLTEGGAVWAYAAVIDNATGDPTIVPAIVP